MCYSTIQIEIYVCGNREMKVRGKLYIERKRHAKYSDLTPSDKVKTSSPGVRPENPRHAGQLHNYIGWHPRKNVKPFNSQEGYFKS